MFSPEHLPVFKELLLALYDYAPLGEHENEHISTIRNQLIGQFPSLADRRVVERMLAEPKIDMISRNKFLHFEPVRKGARTIVPVFTLQADFTIEPAKVSIVILHFMLDNDNTTLCSLPMRFEASEGKGKHDYFHMQCLTSLSHDHNNVLGCPPWLPIKQPAIPVDANDPVQLLLCAAIGLYGKDFIGYLQRNAPSIVEYVKRMHLAA